MSPPENRLPLCPSTNPPYGLSEVSLTCWMFWSKLPGARKEAGQGIIRAWHEGPKKLRQLLTKMTDGDEDGYWWCYGVISVFKKRQGCRPSLLMTVIIILVLLLTRPGNCGTCYVGQAIRATPSKMHPWSGWRLAVWSQLLLGAHSRSNCEQEPVRAETALITLIGFEPDFLTCNLKHEAISLMKVSGKNTNHYIDSQMAFFLWVKKREKKRAYFCFNHFILTKVS